MPTYEPVNEDIRSRVERLVEKYHQPLKDARVQLDLLWARSTLDGNGDITGPAIKHQGYPCAAVVRVIGLKDRSKGMGDAEILLDADRWDEWSEEEQNAIIDHELEHLELARDSEGAIKRDDLDRPKLRLRKHDHQFGWFDSIVRRHGSNALEWQQHQAFVDGPLKQLWLPYVDEEQPSAASGKRKGKAKGGVARALQDAIDKHFPGAEVTVNVGSDEAA